MDESQQANDLALVETTADLTIAWLSNPSTKASTQDLLAFIETAHASLAKLGSVESASEPEFLPAVTVRKSLSSPDHLISMIDGKPYRMLKRHLGTHGLTPAQYRERYNLTADYPMVAPNYADNRSKLAKANGLGRGPRGKKLEASATSSKAPSVADQAQPERSKLKPIFG